MATECYPGGVLDTTWVSSKTYNTNSSGTNLSIPAFAHITQGDVSLLIDFSFSNPQILHWGKSLGSIDSVSDYVKASLEPIAHAEHDEHHFVGIWRENANGNVYHPALLGHRSGSDFSQRFEVTKVDQSSSFLEIHAPLDHGID